MKYLFFIILFFTSFISVGFNANNPGTKVEKKAVVKSQKRFKKFRHFDVKLPKEVTTIKKRNVSVSPLKAEALINGVPISEKIKSIRGALAKVKENKLFTKLFTEEDLISLPLGIPNTVGGQEFIIVIDKVRLTPRGTLIDIGLVVKFPGSGENEGKELVFGAFDIPFSQERGFGGGGKLALLNDFEFPLSKDISVNFKGTASQGKTFVNFGCEGYQNMGLEFDVNFAESLIRPADINGNVIEGQKISVPISMQVESFDDLILEVSLPRFRMGKDHDRGFVFEASDIVYDQSETKKGAAVVFPANYHSTAFLEGAEEMWKGFFIRKAMVMLPSDFDKVMSENKSRDAALKEAKVTLTEEERANLDKQDNKELAKANRTRTSFEVHNLIIDDQGFTANFQGHQLLTLEKGKLGGGWALSLVKIEVEIEKSQFIMADLNGKLQIPISDEERLISYQAEVRSGGKFYFFAETQETLPFKPLGDKSELLLTRTAITLEIQNGDFYGAIDLDGSMTVGSKDSDLELADISFQGLLIETAHPYISAVAFSASSDALEQKLSGKALTINELSINAGKGAISLKVDATIELHKGSEGFGGGGAVEVFGMRNESGWAYDRTEVSKITIDISKEGVFSIKGTIAMLQDDPVYGDVFIGVVEAKLGPTASAEIGIESTIMFGKKGNHHYWYVDCLAVLPGPGITVGPMAFQGFGGGLYYGMDKLPQGAATGSMVESATGGVYVPNESIGFGFKAIIIFSVPQKETVIAETTFEMTFNRGGGVRYAMFAGCANIMASGANIASMDELKAMAKNAMQNDENEGSVENIDVEDLDYGCSYLQAGNAPIFAKILIELDFLNDTYHGELSVDINAGVVTGGGRAIVHFAPDTWYIHIGTNKNPIRLSLMGAIEATSYFMFGDNLPDGFATPREVVEILKKDPNQDLEGGRDESTLSGGRGVAFGAAVHIKTPELNFLIFYASINAGLGFDLMLKNYGANAVCANTGKTIGMNGWFAQGQIYAYIKAKIGVKVNLKFIKGKFEIIDAGFAALLQFKGPNPVYAYGIVGGYFNILGGMVSGQCSFEFTLGEECKLQGASPLGGMEIIASMTPVEGSEDVDVFSAPQIVFNVPINTTMELLDPNTNQKKSYRINIKDLKLESEKGGAERFEWVWNNEHTTLVLQPESMLQNLDQYKCTISLDFREKSGNKWVPVNSNDELVRTLTFKSGARPDFIDHERVTYAYPIERQMNFYIDESSTGYLEMTQKGWDYLFVVEDAEKWDVKARFTSYNDENVYSNVSYEDHKQLVSFSIPSDMKINSIYKMDLVHLPKTSLNTDQNVTVSTEQLDLGDDSNETSIQITERNTTGEALASNEEKVIYTTDFRTSQWKTFPSKMENLQFSEGVTGILPFSNRYQMNTFFNAKNNETLDGIELNGVKNTKQLVDISVDFTDEFYQNIITPLMYHKYPLYGAEITWRTEEQGYGWVKPTKSLYFSDNREGPVTLTDDEINTGVLTNHYGYRIFYNPDYFIGVDFKDFQAELEDLAADGLLNIADDFERKKINFIRVGIGAPKLYKGEYHIISTYTLPGKNTPSSTYKIKMTNRIQ